MSHKIKRPACQARLKASETKRISGRDIEEVMRQSWQLRSRVLRALGSVSQKSRNFSGLFRVSQFSLYLRNVEVLSHRTSQSSWFFSDWRHVQRSAFQNKGIVAWQRVFRARKVLGTFEKHATWLEIWWHRVQASLWPQTGFFPRSHWFNSSAALVHDSHQWLCLLSVGILNLFSSFVVLPSTVFIRLSTQPRISAHLERAPTLKVEKVNKRPASNKRPPPLPHPQKVLLSVLIWFICFNYSSCFVTK